MEFKKLSIADKEIIKPFFADVFTKEPWNDDWSDAAQLDAYITDLCGNVNSLTLALFDGEQMVALSMGYIKHWYRGTEYIINELCVKTEKQHQGIGTEFLHQIEDYLKANDLKAIYLLTERTVPAYNFYKKNGFYEYTDTVAFAWAWGTDDK